MKHLKTRISFTGYETTINNKKVDILSFIFKEKDYNVYFITTQDDDKKIIRHSNKPYDDLLSDYCDLNNIKKIQFDLIDENTMNYGDLSTEDKLLLNNHYIYVIDYYINNHENIAYITWDYETGGEQMEFFNNYNHLLNQCDINILNSLNHGERIYIIKTYSSNNIDVPYINLGGSYLVFDRRLYNKEIVNKNI